MNRDACLAQLEDRQTVWDVVIIGGGATGLGAAVEAASRGYRTVLLEQHDFAKGTSSRSTKLVHGGVRYLRQGDISLVIEALRERGLLMRNAPHLVHHRAFVVPSYEWWEGPFYGVGLKVYDALAGKLGIGRSRLLSRAETLAEIPNIEPEGLRGGVVYFDGQFDDSRLAINLAQTCADLGGAPVNYLKVVRLIKSDNLVRGVVAQDVLSGRELEITGRVIINATGVFADSVLRMDEPSAPNIIQPSQGVHLVFDKSFLPGESAIMVPQTDDGRVLFAVPWLDRVIVGTTDTPVAEPSLEPQALEEEVEFILQHAGRYMARDPDRSDVLSVFAGLRPLVKAASTRATASISRDHLVMTSASGLVTVTGGKWTTYRKMGEDVINQAALVAGLDERETRTPDLRIHGWAENLAEPGLLSSYGSDASRIRALIQERPALGEPLHPNLPYLKAEVVWAARGEMACTVEDVLARRTRALLLDARASVAAAPEVATLMAAEMSKSSEWKDAQVREYTALASSYCLVQS